MRVPRLRPFKTAKIALPLLLVAVPNLAQAHGIMLIGPQIGSSLLLLLGSGSQCLGIVYDANGNRISQGSSTVGTGAAVWGADKYGCVVWG